MMPRVALILVPLTLMSLSCAVDCEPVCAKMLACNVTFDAPDDPNGDQIALGTRTQSEACVLGCMEVATPELESCVQELEIDGSSCQDEVLQCVQPVLIPTSS